MSERTEIISLMERMGMECMPKQFTDIQNKVIRLVESCGVAGSPYKSTVQAIVTYIERCLTKIRLEKTETITNIPKELTEKIDFIENLDIIIKVYNSTDENDLNDYGGGLTHFSDYDCFINNKLNNVKIVIEAISFYGYIHERTVTNTLYHEINHCYDVYNDLKTNNVYARMIRQFDKSNIPDIKIFNNKTANNLFNIILYRLFSETEFNALIASVYGDLQGIKSKRENFQYDIKELQAYNIYKAISTNYKYLYKLINKDNANQIKQLLDKYGINVNPYNNGVESFVKELTRKTNYLLKKLIDRIGKAASLYYDEHEDRFPPRELHN